MRPTQSTSHPYVYRTPRGSLRGLEYQDIAGNPVLYRFTKVPYALPPVGSRRWRRPQPLPSDFSFNDAASGEPGDYTKFGPICPQPKYAHGLALIENPDSAPPIENVQDEDCLYLNIWVPAGPKPSGGWPVQFFIHGGWLQVGDAMQGHAHDPFDLLANTTPRIVVSPTHRLNLFGFLAGEDLASLHEDPAPSNYGFWDQRCALEWTAQHIEQFGGNPKNITVGGLSAGANSTFFQLNYDSQLPVEQRLIRRVFLWSNAVAIQPNSSTSPVLTSQFNELCSVFGIPGTATPAEKLAALRKIPAPELVSALSKLKMHTFRASTDEDFVNATLLASLHSGTFTTRLFRNGTSVLLGEVSDEKELYKLVNPPANYDDLVTQLVNYYPPPVVQALLPLYNVPDKTSTDAAAWAEVFCQIVGDGQVHASVRGLTHVLLNPPSRPGVTPLPPSRVHRYRIAWRAKVLDNWYKAEAKVFHSADIPIWWASGWRYDYTDGDKGVVKKFLEPFGQFLDGKQVDWPCSGEDRLRLLDQDGEIHEDVVDELWERGLQVWNAVWDAQKATVVKEDETGGQGN
ncbi:hypothetical protein A1O3_09792 [Capronia epimyces CBS 606.96]|uniref:Carboxylic ester hydrolase n=1 Tax=Capronia epimyces CBS 606.96 TaxID=1182542 RepID=W9XJP0_9EURO|nr:uncharacterized protein A1O3_09792 [Capronia epimyces CBS 606.96]EXJ77565.1 hypothetical protein A1O3_09792 [Capronia epimyces CBS 606.96]